MGSNTLKQISIFLSVLVSLALTYLIINNLSVLPRTVTPELYLSRVAIALAAFNFAILGGWYSFRPLGGIALIIFASGMCLFASSVAGTPLLIWSAVPYVFLLAALFLIDQHYENQIAGRRVDGEQFQNEKNDLEAAYKTKGEAISVHYEKYSTYYNLRKLAEELSSSLSVPQLAQVVVDRAFDFIPRGDRALIAFSQAEGSDLPVVASRRAFRVRSENLYERTQEGDHYDIWVIKNRRRLIVGDTHQDFRFDVKEAVRRQGLRSMIVAPLFNEGRVMGTLRINAAGTDIFTNDDLRLLDTIAVLASSALSNAIFYEKTEELAIKDSLTGLFVRRYFFDRLKEEHRRALLTHRPLSLLMCDLDHFKECNDRLGHAVGDLMLIHLAGILNRAAENAVVARYGGEEFAVVLPERSKEEAARLANRIREDVEGNPYMLRREKINMTLSIGVSSFPEDGLDMESLVHKSDQALYQAKRLGRNRVC